MLVKFRERFIKLPDFFIIGAGKSGTTSLAKYIAQHPQIYVPEVKELHFFLFANNPPDYYSGHVLGPVLIYSLDDYISYFKDAEDKLSCDCSVTYMYRDGFKQVIKNIKKFYTNGKWKELKFIVILRDPIERAFSQYITRLCDGEDEPFVKACFSWGDRKRKGWSIAYDYLGFSFYYEPLKAYIHEFGRDNIRIYLYEDLKERPLWLVKDIFQFLGVDPEFVPRNVDKYYNISLVPKSKIHGLSYEVFVVHNPLKYPLKYILPVTAQDRIRYIIKKLFMRRRPVLAKEDRERLKPIFREDILKLHNLIGRNLSHWMEK